MAKRTSVTFSDSYFDAVLQSAGVSELCESKARQALAVARSTAPVKTGLYRDSLAVESREAAHRKVWYVVGHAPHTLLVEMRTGNLARACKAVC